MKQSRSDRMKGYATLFIITVFLWFSSFVMAYLTIIRNDYLILDDLIIIKEDTEMIRKMIGRFACMYDQDAIDDFYIDNQLVRTMKLDDQNYILYSDRLSLKLIFKDDKLFDYEIEP